MNAISSDVFCFTHSPQTKEAKQRAVTKGGKASKPRLNEELLPYMALTKRSHFEVLIKETAEQLRTPPMTYQKALGIGSLMDFLIQIETDRADPKNQEGLADIILKGLYPERNQITASRKKRAYEEKQNYLKLLEEVINSLRTVTITAQKVQAIVRLASMAYKIVDEFEPEEGGLAEILIKEHAERRAQKLTASVQ